MSQNLITGTIAQLVGKLEINGTVLNQAELSVMTRILSGSAFRKIGEIRKEGARGRPTNVWEIDTDALFSVNVNSNAPQASVTEPEAEDAPESTDEALAA